MEKKLVIVTGASGQLGKEIEYVTLSTIDSTSSEYEYVFLDHSKLDITDYHQSLMTIDEILKENGLKKPSFIVNCAAYTNVNGAESDVKNAMDINAHGSDNLAKLCSWYDSVLIHISTDYVYNGEKNTPYIASLDTPSPIGIYGMSKYLGERYIVGSGCKYLIFRTSWLYSTYGKNFVKNMVNKLFNEHMATVVCDQVGSPTYARDLAYFIVENIESGSLESFASGTYHFCNKGVASWFDLTTAIADIMSKYTNFPRPEVRSCYSREYPCVVKRPSYSVLDTEETFDIFDGYPKYWRDSLEQCIDLLAKEGYFSTEK